MVGIGLVASREHNDAPEAIDAPVVSVLKPVERRLAFVGGVPFLDVCDLAEG